MAMEFDRKYAVQGDINQIEEAFRDAIVKAHEERYRKLREVVSKLLAETPKSDAVATLVGQGITPEAEIAARQGSAS